MTSATVNLNITVNFVVTALNHIHDIVILLNTCIKINQELHSQHKYLMLTSQETGACV